MTDEQLPPIPRYNLARVLQLRNTLARDTLTEFVGFIPRGDTFDDLVNLVADSFPRVRHRILRDSLEYLAGSLITEEKLLLLSWRLAGNIAKLRAGVAVQPWHVQHEKEWVPAQVLSWQPESTPGRKPGNRFALRVLAGTACPLKVTAFWTRGLCQMLARRAGFTSRRHAYPFEHPACLVNCRLWLLLDPDFCTQNAPGFREVGCSAGLVTWNKEILKRRFRRDGHSCPYSYDHRCFQCPVGYEDCPAATHQHTVEEEQDELQA